MQIHRHYTYDAIAEIDEQSYERTYTDDVGYAFTPTDDVRDQLRSLVRDAVERETGGTVEAVDVEPGYIRATVSLGNHSVAPKAVKSALAGASAAWNERYATPSGGDGYLDGVRFGEKYIGIARPESAPPPEEFIEHHCDLPTAEDVSDPGEPVLVVEEGDPGRPPTASDDRHLPITGIVPIDPKTYEPEDVSGRYNDETVSFRWTGDTVDDFATWIRNRGRWNTDYRVTVYPHYARVDLLSGSLSTRPETIIHRNFDRIVNKFNMKRPEVDVDAPLAHQVKRPKLETSEAVYIGGLSAESLSDEWIQDRGLDDVTAAPVDTGPDAEGGEAEDDTEGDDGNGVFGFLG